jgi:hypothetical protein
LKPNFSGVYVLDREASRLSASASAMTATLRIEHRDPVFRCSGNFVAGGTTANEFTFEVKSQ